MTAFVADPTNGVLRAVRACRECGQAMFMGLTKAGKWCPFDVVDGAPIETSHFTTCTAPGKFSRKAHADRDEALMPGQPEGPL